MPTEIERKFLVLNDSWRAQADAGSPYRQGYIPTTDGPSLRLRIAGDKAYLTIKSKPTAATPLTRAEYEYEIPTRDAQEMLQTLCAPGQIEKTRHTLQHEKHLWVIDVFHGANTGLTMAEIELTDETEPFASPAWLGAEVSTDPRYTNAALATHPMPPDVQ